VGRIRTGRRGRTRACTAFALAFALVGCAAGSDRRESRAGVGFEACADQPDTCNAGDRADGGTVTWLVEQPWGGVYNSYRPEGSTYYLRQILAGTVPPAGDYSPAGEWTWSTDLFAKPPSVVGQSPQTMVFPIAPDAVWSEGEPISVDDFLFAWFHNSGREDHCVGCKPADTTGWELVDRITAGDQGKTVTITLRAGAADAEWFAHFWPSQYPAHVAKARGFDWRTPEGMGRASEFFVKTAPTWSGGPYLIESIVPDERAVLVPNPKWYGRVRPTLDRIVLEVIPKPGDWALAVQNRELDGGAPLSFNRDVLVQLAETGGVRTTVGYGGGTLDHLELNGAGPALADLALRRAILTAFDTGQVRQRIFGDLTPTLRTNHFFEASSVRHQDVVTPTGFGSGDLNRARAILAGAGYTGATPGGSLAKGGVRVPNLRFLHGPTPTRVTFVEVVQAQLAQIGITVTPVPTPSSEFISTIGGGRFDLAAFSLGAGPLVVGAPGQLFRSDSPVNFTKIQDARIDGLIDRIRSLVEIDAVADAANEIAALALGHATLLPLWDNPAYAFVRDGYVNVRDNRYSSVRSLYNVEAWGLGR
jgi:peptide/nickel transport system substrate-binding protein